MKALFQALLCFMLTYQGFPMRTFVFAINHENRSSVFNVGFALANSDYPDN